MSDLGRERVESEVDAIGRCKQCGKPVTPFNKVTGPTGMFCSAECKEMHQAFMQRAQKLESQKKPKTLGMKLLLSRIIGKTLVILVLVLFIALVLSFFGITVPFLTPLGDWMRSLVGV